MEYLSENDFKPKDFPPPLESIINDSYMYPFMSELVSEKLFAVAFFHENGKFLGWRLVGDAWGIKTIGKILSEKWNCEIYFTIAELSNKKSSNLKFANTKAEVFFEKINS